MAGEIQVEKFQGVHEPAPAAGETVYHATVFVADSHGKEWPNGFVFHAPVSAKEDELQRLAAQKWSEISQKKSGAK